MSSHVAVHEAAHARISRAMNFTVFSILALERFGETNVRHPDHDRLRRGIATSEPASLAWAEDFIVIVLAGMAAEHVVLGGAAGYEPPFLESFEGVPDDATIAFEAAEVVSAPMQARATCERLMARATSLVVQHRAEIELLAEALDAAGGRMAGSEMEAALAKP